MLEFLINVFNIISVHLQIANLNQELKQKIIQLGELMGLQGYN